MDNFKKKDKNRSYYERNKERILERARLRAQSKAPKTMETEGSVVSLFNKPNVDAPKRTRSEKSKMAGLKGVSIEAETVFLLILIVLMTSFLFHETAKFFFVLDMNWGGACLKAGILEGAAIAFTIMQGRSRAGSVFNKIMVILIYCFSVWGVSYPIVSNSRAQEAKAGIQQKVISELEGEVSKKVAIRDLYWQQDRVTFARRYDQSLDDLRRRLDIERNRSLGVSSVTLIWGALMAEILFRVLIMISNFSCIQYLRARRDALS